MSICELVWDPRGIAVDPAGNLYIADQGNQRIRKVDTNGIVSTIAGSGTKGFKDGPALQAQFNDPSGITVDSKGNVYIADQRNHRIRKLDTKGNVTTIAGTGVSGLQNGNALTSQLSYPNSIVFSQSGAIYITDLGNDCVRKIILP